LTVKRTISALFLVAGVLLLAYVLQPTVRSVVNSIFSRENSYAGKSTSHWRRDLVKYLDRLEYGGSSKDVPLVLEDLPAVRLIRNQAGLESREPRGDPFPRARSAPGLVPVLIDLLSDADPRVRTVALEQVWALGYKAKGAAPAVSKLLSDKSVAGKRGRVDDLARIALMEIDPEGAAKLGLKGDPQKVSEHVLELKWNVPQARLWAARRLYNLTFLIDHSWFESARPALVRALNDHTRDPEWDEMSVSEIVALTIKRLSSSPKYWRPEWTPAK
jgi:hypothetical protein